MLQFIPPTPEVFPGGSWERPWEAGTDGEDLALDYQAGGAFATVEGDGEIGQQCRACDSAHTAIADESVCLEAGEDPGHVAGVNVEIASGEVVLFWDCAARDASRMARAIRADMSQLEGDDFIARWGAVESPADLV